MVNTEQLAQIFSGTEGITAAYFFGSQVSGKTDAFSDYDFAVLLPRSGPQISGGLWLGGCSMRRLRWWGRTMQM